MLRITEAIVVFHLFLTGFVQVGRLNTQLLVFVLSLVDVIFALSLLVVICVLLFTKEGNHVFNHFDDLVEAELATLQQSRQ